MSHRIICRDDFCPAQITEDNKIEDDHENQRSYTNISERAVVGQDVDGLVEIHAKGTTNISTESNATVQQEEGSISEEKLILCYI